MTMEIHCDDCIHTYDCINHNNSYCAIVTHKCEYFESYIDGPLKELLKEIQNIPDQEINKNKVIEVIKSHLHYK